jgi:hypothetical protein
MANRDLGSRSALVCGCMLWVVEGELFLGLDRKKLSKSNNSIIIQNSITYCHAWSILSAKRFANADASSLFWLVLAAPTMY